MAEGTRLESGPGPIQIATSCHTSCGRPHDLSHFPAPDVTIGRLWPTPLLTPEAPGVAESNTGPSASASGALAETATSLSKTTCSRIRRGLRVPHPRHRGVAGRGPSPGPISSELVIQVTLPGSTPPYLPLRT